MSNMPDEGGSGRPWYGQQTARPDVPAQPGEPAPPTQQPSTPQQQQWERQQWQQQQGPQPYTGRRRPFVPEAETRVTGRRIVQYIIDYVLAGIVPGIVYWLFDRNGGSVSGVRWFAATIIALAAYFVYWVVIPHGLNGQTFGMKLLGLRCLSKDGRPASLMQWFIRSVLLIIDMLIFGLVGLITVASSRYRQRVGDHAAGTVVVPARFGTFF